MSKAAATWLSACLIAVLACSSREIVVQGVAVSVASTERMELWQGYSAPPGEEFFVVHLALDARRIEDAVTLPGPRLQKADGSFARVVVKELSVSGGAEHEPEVGFPISKGTEPVAVVFDAGQLTLSGQ